MSSDSILPNENSVNTTNEELISFPSKINTSRKCYIKNAYGIITPKDTDIFTSIFYSKNKDKNKEERNQNDSNRRNTIKIKIIDTNKISWSKNPFGAIISTNIVDKENRPNNENTINKAQNPLQFKATQEYIRTINKDSIEIIIPSKPILNSTASKSFMQEYSKSKKYQEDLKNSQKENIFMPSSPQSIQNAENSDDKIINEAPPDEENSIDSLEDLLKYQESHLPVPIKEKDNETFKILTMKKMKRKTMPPNKSVRKFAEDREPNYEKESCSFF